MALAQIKLVYSPTEGKFNLMADRLKWSLTYQELITAMRGFEKQIAEGNKDLILEMPKGGINFYNCPRDTAVAILYYCKEVIESFRKSRYGLGTN